MKTPVFQFVVYNPESGVDAVLFDLLRMDLPAAFLRQVAVAGLHAVSDNVEGIRRLAKGGRIVAHAELQSVLEGSVITRGWFFVGAHGTLGENVEPVDVPRVLSNSAFVVDILDGRFVYIRTVVRSMAEAIQKVVLGIKEIDQCDLEGVRLTY